MAKSGRQKAGGCQGFFLIGSWRDHFASPYLVPPQRSDFVRGKSELGQNLLGLLAELRRPRRHLARGARQRDRLTDQADVAVFLVLAIRGAIAARYSGGC